MRRYRNRRYARRMYRRRAGRNMYFKQHSEQSRYAKLAATNNIVKRIVSVDTDVFLHQGFYSLSESAGTYANMIDYGSSQDFQKYAALYQQYRIVGVKLTVYRTTAPQILVSESTNTEFGLLGVNISIGQPITSQTQTIESDTTLWLSFLGEWISTSKFYSFSSRVASNEVIEWQPTSTQDKGIWLSIATKGDPTLPSGWKMYYISVQVMTEFANPI